MIDQEYLAENGFQVLPPDSSMNPGMRTEAVLDRTVWLLDRMVAAEIELIGKNPKFPTSYREAPTAVEGKGLITPHLEGIYSDVPLEYFMLGCVSAARNGGETFVMDGRRLAAHLRRRIEIPRDFSVEYTSWGGVEADAAVHPLIDVRGGFETVQFAHSGSVNRQTAYPDTDENRVLLQRVEELVSDAVKDPEITTHIPLKPGEILVINNNTRARTTMHHRTLFDEVFPGQRELIRFRLSDPMANTYTLPGATNLEVFTGERLQSIGSRPWDQYAIN